MARLASVIIQIRHQIDAIEDWTRDRSFGEFANDMMLSNAIERSVEIISEATRRVPESEKQRFPEVPWRDVADIGNYLRHQYHELDPKVLWDLTHDHFLKDLREAIEGMNPDVEAERSPPPSST